MFVIFSMYMFPIGLCKIKATHFYRYEGKIIIFNFSIHMHHFIYREICCDMNQNFRKMHKRINKNCINKIFFCSDEVKGKIETETTEMCSASE